MKSELDMLDKLQDEEGYVKLELTSGKVVFGKPQCIVFDEDDEGWETVKLIRFDTWLNKRYVLYGLEDIKSYERIKKEDLPKPKAE